jgi:hypothetical protein
MSDRQEPANIDWRSADIAEDRRLDLLRLFPEVRTEGGKIDFDRLRLALGETHSDSWTKSRQSSGTSCTGCSSTASSTSASPKGSKDFLKLRNAEADKVNCGKRHFQAIGVSFDVVVSADEV